MSNKALWDRVCITDPRAVKPITGKQYQGNSPKPYWIVERLTEEFGPCGKGWGFEIADERFERLTETDVLHVARVSFWHSSDRSTAFEQMGQTKAVYAKKDGTLMVDEDAPKKSVTDALVKCASYLGFAGDIFSGRWDDSKYVAEAREFYERKEHPELAAQEKRNAELEELALYLIDCHKCGNDMDAIRVWYDPATWSADNPTETEERKFVWGLLKEESKLRSTIKANKPEAVAA